MELNTRKIYITEPDLQRLQKHLPLSGQPTKDHLRALRACLDTAAVVSPGKLPRDVVTLGTRFRIRDLRTEEEAEYTLVLPSQADLSRGYISILAPIGASLLGAQVQETITFSTPATTKAFRIEAIVAETTEAAPLRA